MSRTISNAIKIGNVTGNLKPNVSKIIATATKNGPTKHPKKIGITIIFINFYIFSSKLILWLPSVLRPSLLKLENFSHLTEMREHLE